MRFKPALKSQEKAGFSKLGLYFSLLGLFSVVIVCASFFKKNALSPTFKVSETITVNPGVFDFGKVFQSQTINCVFSLTNRSNNEIQIVAFRPSCSCTFLESGQSPKSIPPRGSISFPVAYEVGERSGEVSSFVSIFVAQTNMVNRLYEVQAHLKGTVLPEFTINPPTIEFGSIKPGERVTKQVRIVPVATKNLEITEPISRKPHLQISIQKAKEVGGDNCWVADITFQPPTNIFSVESVRENLELRTSSDRVPIARVRVTGKIVPEVEVIPNVIVVHPSGLEPVLNFL